MVYHRGPFYYVKRTFRGLGKIEKSLRTRDEDRARDLEAMLSTLHERGRLDLLRAWRDGGLEIERLAEAYESGRLHDLSHRLENPEIALEDACEAALDAKRADVAESTLARYETGLDHFRAVTTRTTVAEALTTDVVRAFKAARRKAGAAKETVNNDLQAVSILATYAVERGWIEERPTINKYPPEPRIRWLDAGQLRAYMACLRQAFRPQMQFLAGTGVRLGESEGLRATDLRLGKERTEAVITDAKDKTVRTVFVPSWVAETLEERIERKSLAGKDRLFTIARRTVQSEHNRACGLAGIHDYTIHDHRSTAAVQMAKAGMPLNLIQRQLGHKNIEQTMRYARFHPDYGDVAPHFEAMGERLGLGSPGDTAGGTAESEAEEGEGADRG